MDPINAAEEAPGMDAQMVLWTRYELSQLFGPSSPRRTRIRPSPGRQTSASVDQRPPTTTKNQQVRGCLRPRNAGPPKKLTDLRRLITVDTGRWSRDFPDHRPELCVQRVLELSPSSLLFHGLSSTSKYSWPASLPDCTCWGDDRVHVVSMNGTSERSTATMFRSLGSASQIVAAK
jgi:hypothetical protein